MFLLQMMSDLAIVLNTEDEEGTQPQVLATGSAGPG